MLYLFCYKNNQQMWETAVLTLKMRKLRLKEYKLPAASPSWTLGPEQVRVSYSHLFLCILQVSRG